MKSVSFFLLLYIILFHVFFVSRCGQTVLSYGGKLLCAYYAKELFFLFWKGFDVLQSGRVAKINNIFSAKRAKKCDFVAVIQYIMS